MISMLGVMIGTAALIIVLSVFNGFENLVLRLYNSFDPDIKITAVEGKSFLVQDVPLQSIRDMNGVKAVAEIIEENALVKYRDKQTIVSIKGVSDDYAGINRLDTLVVDGNFQLKEGDLNYALVGGMIAYNLNLNTADLLSQLEIYAPRRTESSLLDPEAAFNRQFISPSGVFSVQQEFDAKYIIVPLRFVESILEYSGRRTSLEIAVQEGQDAAQLQEKIQQVIGPHFIAQNRFQQHALLYKIMKSEKWAVFLILTFILIIATFNVISSLTMLVIEKKEDVAILFSMGANTVMLRKIFLFDGLFITLIGATGGLVLGFVVCLIQEKFGLIQLGGSGTFVIDAYPVQMLFQDFLYVFATVFIIGWIAAWYPSKRLIGKVVDLRGVKSED